MALLPPWMIVGSALTFVAIGFGLGWWLKPGGGKLDGGKLYGYTLLVGIRSGTRNCVLRLAKTIRGVYEWTEKDDFEADVYLEEDTVMTDKNTGLRVALVDLQNQQPVAYEGTVRAVLADAPRRERLLTRLKKASEVGKKAEAKDEFIEVQPGADDPGKPGNMIVYPGVCINDGETVTVEFEGERHILTGVWRRLSGLRLFKVRKDHRLTQLGALGSSIWTFLTKIAPVALVVIALLLPLMLVAMGVLMYMVGK